ncbi:MAG: hypothetical protein U5R14_08505 [Gemmatimonadota bacterium]|nr:hypothetical protein [Gemmatimonadota bacterium]
MNDDQVGHGSGQIAVFGKTPFLPLDRSDFQELKDAKGLLVDALALEEGFHLVLANFYEYEGALLDRALYSLLCTEGSWSECGRNHPRCRPKSREPPFGWKRIPGSGAVTYSAADSAKTRTGLARFNAWRSIEYDSRLGYRAMEALRNYTQHPGSCGAVRMSHQFWRDRLEEGSTRRNAIVPSIDTERLREDGGFSRTFSMNWPILGRWSI